MAHDADALNESFKISKAGHPHTIRHYLYHPSRHGAAALADELRRLRFRVEDGMGADGVNWLVLAQHEIVPSGDSIGVARVLMEDLVARLGGEYDGWEAEVPPA